MQPRPAFLTDMLADEIPIQRPVLLLEISVGALAEADDVPNGCLARSDFQNRQRQDRINFEVNLLRHSST